MSSAPIKYRALFCLHRHDRELDPQLQCRVKWGSSKYMVTVNTGFRVNPERWDADRQRCAAGSFHGARRIPAATINDEIRRYLDVVDGIFSDFAATGVFPSPTDVKSALNAGLYHQTLAPSDEDVFAAFDKFCTEQGAKNAWSDGTYIKWRVFRRHMANWKPLLSWSDFDEKGLTSFVAYLRDVRQQKNATIKKQLGYMRWFLTWADHKGYLTVTDYKIFKPKFKGQEQRQVIFLTWDELMAVWDWEPEERQLHGQVRDVFLFCCFSSLRWSDVQNLRWSDVHEKSITITTVKTADPLEIQLNRWSQELLWRYVDEGLPDDRVFPVIGNQVANKYLHEICRDCGIDETVHRTWYRGSERHDDVKKKWELVTTHCGRRTFICNALAMGIPPTVVMQWTGHSDYAAMQPYIGVSQDTKAAAMELFNTKKDTE